MMNWSAFNVLSRTCPACSSVVPWTTRKVLLKKNTVKCCACKSTLMIHTRDRFINLLVIGFFLSYFHCYYFGQPSFLREIMIGMMMVAFNIPKYLNVLFSLQCSGQPRMKYSKHQNKRQKSP